MLRCFANARAIRQCVLSRPARSYATKQLSRASTAFETKQSNTPASKRTKRIGSSSKNKWTPSAITKGGVLVSNDSTLPYGNLSMEDVTDILDSAVKRSPPVAGSFVEMRRDAEAICGVVIKNVRDFKFDGDSMLVISTKGECSHWRTTDVMFSVPAFVEADLAERCGQITDEDMDATLKPSELDARLEVLQHAREFERAIEQEYIALGKDMDGIHSKTCASNPNDWTTVSTRSVAAMVCNQRFIPLQTLFAVHKHLMNRADEFLAQPLDHRAQHVFDVRPAADLENLRMVRLWLRDGNTDNLDSFVDKTRALIDRYRSEKGEETNTTVIEPIPTDIVFSDSDLEFIKFIRDSLFLDRTIQKNPYLGFFPSILKKIDRYEGALRSGVVIKFLTEIGHFTPWEDIHSQNRELIQSGISSIKIHDELSKELKISASYSKNLDSDGLYISDPHGSLRHDFGDLPVFVIDDAHAKERDDGMSIERIPSEPGAAWIHVHIADPTSVIPLGHPIAELARKRVETMYFMQETRPMLPDVPALRDVSLGQNPDGHNVLTVSVKIDKTGNCLQSKVRTGFVRKVHIIQYDVVDELLGLGGTAGTVVYPFEANPRQFRPKDLSHLSPHLEDLRALYDYTSSIIKKRQEKDAFNFVYATADVSIKEPYPPRNAWDQNIPRLYRGFPEMTYSVSTNAEVETGARAMVAECMKLASRITSRFCLEHKVPAVRRSGEPIEMTDPEFAKSILELRNEQCFVDSLPLIKAGFLQPRAEYTLEPKAHWGLGIEEGEGYMRATSPLRRYVDMVGHWQIKCAIQRAAGLKSGDQLPFNEGDLLGIIKEVTHSEQVLKRAVKNHTRYWTHLYIDFYLKNKLEGTKPNALQNLYAYTLREERFDPFLLVSGVEMQIPSLGLITNFTMDYSRDNPPGTDYRLNVVGVEMGMVPRLVLEEV